MKSTIVKSIAGIIVMATVMSSALPVFAEEITPENIAAMQQQVEAMEIANQAAEAQAIADVQNAVAEAEAREKAEEMAKVQAAEEAYKAFKAEEAEMLKTTYYSKDISIDTLQKNLKTFCKKYKDFTSEKDYVICPITHNEKVNNYKYVVVVDGWKIAKNV